jgi:phosphoribosylanthranilate isomerase
VAAVTRVKICGLTRERDVHLAVRSGAWACGFVLSPSPRQVTPARARELAAAAEGALTVAVVTTEPAGAIARALAEAGCEALQLSAGADGVSVDEARAAALARGLRPLVIAAADTRGAEGADLILVDSRRPGQYGGTGIRADWAAAARLAAGRRLMLAGGLNAATAATAVTAVRPFALDVSSGVEASPGVKDEALLRAFFAAVAGADTAAGHTDASAAEEAGGGAAAIQADDMGGASR